MTDQSFNHSKNVPASKKIATSTDDSTTGINQQSSPTIMQVSKNNGKNFGFLITPDFLESVALWGFAIASCLPVFLILRDFTFSDSKETLRYLDNEAISSAIAEINNAISLISISILSFFAFIKIKFDQIKKIKP